MKAWDIIKDLGKFEGECAIAEELWECFLDGFCDDDDGEYLLFTNFKSQEWPGEIVHALLKESDQGFIYVSYYDTAEAATEAFNDA